MAVSIPFDRVKHLVRVPVQVGGEACRFLVDTGIGISVVSSAAAARLDLPLTGEAFSDRRMSGQLVEAPLVELPRIKLGVHEVTGHVAGVADLGPTDGEEGFDGILGPGFFGGSAFTIDLEAMALTIHDAHAPSMSKDAHVVALHVVRDGPSISAFADLVLPSGRTARVEVDTGSHVLILDTRFLPDCGLSLGDPTVETVTGTDETGYDWIRHRATITGSVHLAEAPATAQHSPRVTFQDIVHDGLVGTDYLERYRTTYDVSRARMVLSPRSVTSA